MYMFYILYFRRNPHVYGPRAWENTYVLTTDGDVDFNAASVRDLQA
jgi:hypothetical protein